MSLKTVAVLRGGVGSEHDVSLQTGAQVLRHLSDTLADRYKAIDIFIDRNGVWHMRGAPASPQKVLGVVDAVWNGLHGEYGEDGTVQRTLDAFGVPYTGSGVYASSVAINKKLTKERLRSAGIRTPHAVSLEVSASLPADIVRVFRTFPQPSVIKPVNAGSSVGVSLARTFAEFEQGVKTAFQYAPVVLIEEYIPGREATCAVVDSFRGALHYQLPPVEIIPPFGASFFNYEAKYGAGTVEHCPGHFSRAETESVQEMARHIHSLFGLRHYSRSDFIISPKGVYVLEVNTLPGLTENSLLPKSLQAVGVSLPGFIDHVLTLALNKG